ncbi:MAG TPA: L,D-transpeptidase family protein [Thermoanaerobaculia bacterium]|nr:L,D-transpeptidase family protein [Thermoanaerobaculia bacterium]
MALTAAVACTKQEAKRAGENAKTKAKEVAAKVDDAIDIAVPLGDKDDPAAREKERFDEGWRKVGVFQNAKMGTAPPQQPAVQITFVPNGKESLKKMTAEQLNSAPVAVPIKGDVNGPSVLKTQVYLDRLDFSVGVLDGRWGRNSAIALWWFQRARGINAAEPGAVDEQTFRTLAQAAGGVPALVSRTLSEDDVKGPFVSVPDDMYEKANLDCLCYESKIEKLAERFHTTQEFLESINPDAKFSELKAGDKIWVPNVREPLTQDRPDIARVVVSLRGNTFNAFDAAGNLIFHAPTTVGSKYDPSPNETVYVKSITQDPHFHYQPTLFSEVPDSEPEANLSPGPNSPVGVVWIALSKPHFGIHGTSDPDSIGYASSHGCVRLANWDAAEVSHRIAKDVQVEFLDTQSSTQTASN